MYRRTMLERDIERRMAREVKSRGGLCYKFTSPANIGVPDRVVITPTGRIIFVELKTDTGQLTQRQALTIHDIARHGAEVRVLYGLDAVRQFIEEVLPRGVPAI